MCADFPARLLPWPQITPRLAVDAAPVPRGWEYSVGHWIERGVHRVNILQTSRSIRKISFLGDDDELVIVVSEGQFSWALSENGLTATLEANIQWRTRPDVTRG